MAYTARQQKILDWLSKSYPHSAKLFDAAIKLMTDTTLPCRSQFVAHAYREICSNIMNQYSSNQRKEMGRLLDRIAKEWGSLGISPTSAAAPENEAVNVTDDNVSVPRSFIDCVSSMVAMHVAAPKGGARAHAVFRGMALNPKSAVSGASQTADRWFEMYNYFVGCAHNRTTDDAVMISEEFRRQVTFFEETLLSFAEPAIDNLNALDTILANANG